MVVAQVFLSSRGEVREARSLCREIDIEIVETHETAAPVVEAPDGGKPKIQTAEEK